MTSVRLFRFVVAVAPAAIPSSFVLSAALIEPGADVVAAAIATVRVAVPVTLIGAVPATDVTTPACA